MLKQKYFEKLQLLEDTIKELDLEENIIHSNDGLTVDVALTKYDLFRLTQNKKYDKHIHEYRIYGKYDLINRRIIEEPNAVSGIETPGPMVID